MCLPSVFSSGYQWLPLGQMFVNTTTVPNNIHELREPCILYNYTELSIYTE